MSAAVVALAASGIVTALAGPASAKGGPHGKVTCTSMNGSTSSGTITISGCSGTATPGTGGSSQPLSIGALAAGGVVNWVNGQSTTFAPPALVSGNAKHCPGYAKGASNEPSDEKFAGQVTADTTGMKVPGKYKGEVCIDQSGNITARKPLKIN